MTHSRYRKARYNRKPERVVIGEDEATPFSDAVVTEDGLTQSDEDAVLLGAAATASFHGLEEDDLQSAINAAAENAAAEEGSDHFINLINMLAGDGGEEEEHADNG